MKKTSNPERDLDSNGCDSFLKKKVLSNLLLNRKGSCHRSCLPTPLCTLTSLYPSKLEKLYISPMNYDGETHKFQRSKIRRKNKFNNNVSLNKNYFIYRNTEIKNLTLQRITDNTERMFLFIKDGNFDKLEDLLSKYKMDFEIKDDLGNTPLNLAVQSNWIKIVTLLIQLGANVNTSNNAGNTPLHHAFFDKNFTMADVLIQNGANEKARNNLGLSPWQCLDF